MRVLRKQKNQAFVKMMGKMGAKNKGVSDEDIAKARSIDIWRLHEFRGRIGNSCTCPLHSDEVVSFTVRKNNWICFGGCGKGDGIELYMRLYHYPYYKAVEEMLKIG